jgi:hypothetical protein
MIFGGKSAGPVGRDLHLVSGRVVGLVHLVSLNEKRAQMGALKSSQ